MDLTKKAARELAKEERKHELLRGNLFNEAVAVSLYLCDKSCCRRNLAIMASALVVAE